MEPYRFVYLLLVGAAFLIWLVIFLLRKDLRKEVLTMSALVGVLGVSQILWVGRYWRPEYAFPIGSLPIGLEDILLAAFLYGGVGSVLWQFVADQRYICRPAYMKNPLRNTRILAFLSGPSVFIVLEAIGRWNIVYTSTIALLIPAALLCILRPAYTRAVVANGLLLGALSLVLLAGAEALFPGFIAHTWNLPVLSGWVLLGVPIEEPIFHFAAGTCFAVAYECLFNCQPVRVAYARS